MAKLYFHYSTMNAGKSTLLLQAAHNYQERGMESYLLTAQFDNRAGDARIGSRIGIGREADTFSLSDDLFYKIKKRINDGPCACVFIDEAQFFDAEITMVCETLATRGIRVIVAGLDMDYLGKPFGQMPNLLAVADYITKLHAICMKCGNIAHVSFRKTANESQVLLGEKDTYEPRCRKCMHEK